MGIVFFMQRFWSVFIVFVLLQTGAGAQSQKRRDHFRALVLFENGGHHLAFTDAAQPWLRAMAAQQHFEIDFFTNVDTLSDSLLSHYQLFIQLDYVPYGWPERAQQALIKYLTEGKGGWIGLHHASLLGDFDGYQLWPWFYNFMGAIRFKNYIPGFVAANIVIENRKHPVMKGVDPVFKIEKEEWYTYDKSPRDAVQVLANVDEQTYQPDSEIKMGDHPVVWTNPHVKAKNVYIFMGHSPDLFANKNFSRMLMNAIQWAGKK